jgi:AcrR family transcriptional regulator
MPVADVTTTPARQARGQASRERILQAATDELAEVGDLEVASVAARAGVSVGLPYRYFGSRGGLLIAVIDAFHERLGGAAVYREY